MADVITRFKLETTQFDSKLRDASKGLSEFTKQAKDGGSSFTNFSQKAVESARSLGTIASGATNAKDKLKDLVGAYNDAAKAYNKLSQEQQQSDFGKALANSISQLKDRITEAKNEIYGLGNAMDSVGKGGGLFGGGGISGMLQVFGGNLLTKAAGMAAELGSQVVEVVNASADLAREAEGIEMAFSRLGRGDLLEGLREATHNTVSDLELMKAAVKFDDFNLSLEELGTMLAFAQQKAKDTGQSVDYMVDSIVTGLGRKSLMILDNLGLSASEIKEKMKETGDMTKAVGEIIRQQMSAAGDYVETAADRAAQANVKLENAMLELGNAMRETFGYTGWDDMANGIKTQLVGALIFTVDWINEAKNAWNSLMQSIGLQDRPQATSTPSVTPADGTYWERTAKDGTILASGRWLNGQQVQTGAGEVVVTAPRPKKTKKTRVRTPRRTSSSEKTEEQLNNEQISKLTNEYIKASDDRRAAIEKEISVLQKRNEEIQKLKNQALGKGKAVDLEALFPTQVVESDSRTLGEKLMDGIREGMAAKMQDADINTLTVLLETQLKNGIEGINIPADKLMEKIVGEGADIPDEYWMSLQEEINAKLKELGIEPISINFKTGSLQKVTDDSKEMTKAWQAAGSAIQQVGSAMSSIEDPAAKVMGTIAQAIASVALAAAQAVAAKDTTASGWAWIGAAAAITATMVTMISQIHSATGYAEGGIVGGTSYSGDNVPIMANSQEIVLTKAMTANLASALQENGGGVRVSGEIHGETIVLAANRYLRRSGRGELVTWK